jgi:hypothetical protein
MKKIAVIGVDNQERQILCQALHYLTQHDIVRQMAYYSQAIKYGLSQELKKCTWQELFIYVFSSFSDRIEGELKCEQFISNGSVFNELACMKAICKTFSQSKRERKECLFMLAGMEKIITEYAVREYDCIIHLGNQPGNEDDIENALKELSQKCKTVYFIPQNSILSDFLTKLLTDVHIHPVISSRTALEKAKRDIL